MAINQLNKTHSKLATITKLQGNLDALEHLEGVGIGNDVYVDSNPTEMPNKGSQYDISKHLSASIEQRQINIERGNELKQDWMDAEYWRRLAKERGYTLPHWYIPLSATGIEEALHSFKLGQQFFRKRYGTNITYQEFVDLNPRVPLWVFAGWVLEYLSH
jgi:hypothetical protein